MAISSHHPDYDEYREEWRICRDAYRGEQAIKEAGTRYLPMPGGFKSQPDGGKELYSAYAMRAQFPQILQHTIAGMVGVIHSREAQITMPSALEPIWERATPDGLPLEVFHRRITTELLITGRYGLLVDAFKLARTPLIAGYTAESLINWDENGSLIVVDETDYVRSGYYWSEQPAWRALELEDGRYIMRLRGLDAGLDQVIEPAGVGGRRLDFLPFVIANARDLRAHPEVPPLIGVSRASRNIYQLSADYRWQLFMTGQETLFIFGVPEDSAPNMVGAGVVVTLDGGDGRSPDARYVGPAGTGISAHRTAILDERQAAVMAGAKLFESSGGGQESGEALKLRYAAETATLKTIAQSSAAALEKALRYAAIMMGANPEEVVATPNLEFVDNRMTPQEAESLVRVWQEGAISYQTLYENLQSGGLASSERSYEDEMSLVDGEEFNRQPSPQEAGMLPVQPGADGTTTTE